MNWTEILTNPLSQRGETVKYVASGKLIYQALISLTSGLFKSPAKLFKPKEVFLWKIAGSHYEFVRLAGLLGATAVFMRVYGKYILVTIVDAKDLAYAKKVFKTANRIHILHSAALLAIPLTRRPVLTGSLMAAGTILFSGPMYYRAFTGDKTYIQVATCGGFCLIAAWLSLIF